MNLFVKNISQLVTVASHGRRVSTGHQMSELGIIPDAGVLCREGTIAWVGSMQDWKERLSDDITELDATGKVVVPGFVDSHTHMVFAGSRHDEFVLRSRGATYQQIAEQGGGILSTVRHVREAGKKELKRQAARFMNEMMKHGTTTVEVKSGYGLDKKSEIKMLEAINELKNEEMITVVPTFLGAHAVPPEFSHDKAAMLRMIIDELLPYVGGRHLADFCDVFCEQGYFDVDESRRILEEGKKWGMAPKVHADEMTPSGGAELSARTGAVSADHLEHVTEKGIEALRDSGVIATLLPGVSFFLCHRYAPARRLIDSGVPVALASDFNPGSCMSFSMPLMMTIACTQMGMTTEEALTAATLNGAAAVGKSSTLGSIEVGKHADLAIADIPDYTYLTYHFGTNHIVTTVKNGTILEF